MINAVLYQISEELVLNRQNKIDNLPALCEKEKSDDYAKLRLMNF